MSEYYLEKYNIKPCVVRLEQNTWSKIKLKCSGTSSIPSEKLQCSIEQVGTNDICISIKRIFSEMSRDDNAASVGVRRKKVQCTYIYISANLIEVMRDKSISIVNRTFSFLLIFIIVANDENTHSEKSGTIHVTRSASKISHDTSLSGKSVDF